MVERFNLLAKNKNFNFQAWFNDRIENGRSWNVDESKWKFSYRYIHKIRLFRTTFHIPFCLLKERKPTLLISLYAKPSFIIGCSIAKLFGTRVGFRIVKTFDSWILRKKWKEILKSKIFPKADFVITEGIDGKNFASKYGVGCNRIFIARHGIDISFFRNSSRLDSDERFRLRQKIGLNGIVFLYVGRLVKEKGLYFLIDAFKELNIESQKNVSLVIVGDGPEEIGLKQRSQRLDNIIFTGFKDKEELVRIYGCADVFIFPTLGDPYGLVVDEAMACNLPIICSNSIGEIGERVINGKNGFVVPPANSRTLTDSMLEFVSNPSLIVTMGKASERMIAGHTIEKWVSDFERIVFRLLGRYKNIIL